MQAVAYVHIVVIVEEQIDIDSVWFDINAARDRAEEIETGGVAIVESYAVKNREHGLGARGGVEKAVDWIDCAAHAPEMEDD